MQKVNYISMGNIEKAGFKQFQKRYLPGKQKSIRTKVVQLELFNEIKLAFNMLKILLRLTVARVPKNCKSRVVKFSKFLTLHKELIKLIKTKVGQFFCISNKI